MIVSIHALFSKNELIGSKIISAGSKHLATKLSDVPSHAAVLVNERWVHESTGHSGVRVISYDKWTEINTEVCRVKLDDIEYQIIAEKYREIKDKKYDYPGVIFLALAILPTFVKLPLCKKNYWQSDNKYFCCEALGFLTGHDYSMSVPAVILEKLLYGKNN